MVVGENSEDIFSQTFHIFELIELMSVIIIRIKLNLNSYIGFNGKELYTTNYFCLSYS